MKRFTMKAGSQKNRRALFTDRARDAHGVAMTVFFRKVADGFEEVYRCYNKELGRTKTTSALLKLI